MVYNDFIPQNVAPIGIRRIGIYNAQGNRVGQIPLATLTPPTSGKKQYSFGAVSDVHYQYDTAAEDFKRALTYLNHLEGVAFTCITGDLTDNGSNASLSAYKTAVDSYSPDTPVYAIAGNHEAYRGNDVPDIIEQYTGHPLYYKFEHKGDAFIMVGIRGDSNGNLFADGELQWLYETLEANRNKRCFVFEHVRPQDGCGNALGVYMYDIWGGTEQEVFESLLRHYPNIVFFHGHSHLKFDLQQYDSTANYDNRFGCHSVHIPSISVPRGINSVVNPTITQVYAGSEGYVVDVYENGIHLRGRDFVKGEFLPIASYWLDTTLKAVEAGTYYDPTGTITT